MTEPAVPAEPGFADLGLMPALVRQGAAAGWAAPTAVQAQAIPAALQRRDVLALAPTGTGKTAAFMLPMLQHLLGAPGWRDERPAVLRGLVLVPTRELAAQVADTARGLAPQLKTVVAVGGVSINPQMMALRGGAHLVVATPGRLLDLMDHRALRLGEVDLLVLDEADRLLDLGFAEEITRVLNALPTWRQTLMFSATMPEAVAALAGHVLHDELRVEASAEPDGGEDKAPPLITQRALEVDTPRRLALLRHLIKTEGWQRVLVFVATQYASEHVADKLRQAGVPAAALHGRLSAGRRTQVLADLQSGALAVLVATDLAGRGLHVADLPVVVNFDLPRSAVDHVHRIGRTGRAGQQGLAVSFVLADAPGSEAHFRLIEKRQQLRVPRERIAGFEPTVRPAPPLPADPHGGVKGHRKSKKDKLREAAALAQAGMVRAGRPV